MTNDPLEAEADRVADRVMHMSESSAHTASACNEDGLDVIQPKSAECKEEGKVYKKTNDGPTGEMAAPPVVHDVLTEPGQPLDHATRAFFEPRFGADFGNVRIHTGGKAKESARSIGALAYAHDRNIAFADGYYATGTEAGRRLLAHELAHVVQHNRLVGMGTVSRQPATSAAPDGGGSPANVNATAANPEAQILQWLDHHQFAPPNRQPEGAPEPADNSAPSSSVAQQGATAAQAGSVAPQAEPPELHLLLNGEEMTVAEAVRLAVADSNLKQPPELVASVIKAQLSKPLPLATFRDPIIGAGNQIRGIDLAGPRDFFGITTGIANSCDYSTIDSFLERHGFDVPAVRDPSGSKAIFDGQETPVDQIADQAYALLGQFHTLTKSDVLTYIRQKYVDKRGGPSNQIVFGYMLVPRGLQAVGGPSDPYNPLRDQQQFSFTITRQHHANDSPGLESSLQGVLTLSSHGVMNVQAGGQEAIVMPLLNGWIQVSGLMQVMGSENWNKTASGTTVITPALQVAGGGQILLIPQIRSGPFTFLTGHVQLGAQAVGGVQITSSGAAPVANAGIVLNIPF